MKNTIFPEHPVYLVPNKEILKVENIRLVRLLELAADFGVKTNAKLTPIFKTEPKTEKGYISLGMSKRIS